MSGRPSKIDALTLAVGELSARFEAEAAERRSWLEICTQHPRRIGALEADVITLQLRLARIESDVRLQRRER